MFEISLQLLCTSQSGTLSRIIRELNLLGLQYQSHKIGLKKDNTLISINATGDLNCSIESLEAMFVKLSGVQQVLQLKLTRDGKAVTEFITRVSKTRISSQEPISPAVMLAAEKRLSDILGPIASLIVESAATDSSNAGELFTRLARELDDKNEREQFLSIIVDCN